MIRRTGQPQGAVISLANLKAHLRVDDSDNDGILTSYLAAATAVAETRTGRTLLPATFTAGFSAYEPILKVAAIPLRAVSAVVYLNEDAVETTIDSDDYEIVETDEGFEVRFISTYSAPTLATVAEPITVRFTAGHDAADPVPETAVIPPDPRDCQTILMLVAHWYANREAVNIGNITSEIPLGFQLLAAQRRIYR